MKGIFADFEIIALKRDHEAPGVFLKARKPENYMPIDLSRIALYSVLLGRRTKDIPSFKDMPLARRLIILSSLKINKIKQLVFDPLRRSFLT